MDELRTTPFYDLHVAAGARMVPFAGWRMPLHYGSQIDEHHAVRRDYGMFDVSHMLAIDVSGPQASALLQRVLANDPARLNEPGRALYTCMLNERGGVVDDLIVYRLGAERFRLVANAGNRDKDFAWLAHFAEGREAAVEARSDLALLALQGPRALEVAGAWLGEDLQTLRPFRVRTVAGGVVARTGYTGEDGVELMLAPGHALDAWRQWRDAGVQPCGLGARDTLRLEAGLCLYGQDLDEQTTPLESGLAWTVALEPADRDFLGRRALERQLEAGLRYELAGLLLEERGVLRAGQTVHTGAGEGRVTSGGFAPTMQRSIGLARLPRAAGEGVEVEIRGRRLRARRVHPPFVRRGAVRIEL